MRRDPSGATARPPACPRAALRAPRGTGAGCARRAESTRECPEARRAATLRDVSWLSHQMIVVPERHQLLERVPDVGGDFLLDLETQSRIDADALEVPDHDADHVVGRQ